VTLYKRGSIWWSRFEHRGQVLQRTTRCRAKKDAVQVEAAWRTALAKGEVGIFDYAQSTTLSAFKTRFLEYLPAHVAPRTVRNYTEHMAIICAYPQLGNARLHQIDPAIVQGFIEDRLEHVMPATVNTYIRTLHRALAIAAEWKLIGRAPKLKMLKGERQREFIISEALLSQFLTQCSAGMTRLLPFLIDTGLRISEACNLTWDTVSLEPKQGAERGWVFVAKGKTKNATRYIPLTVRAAGVLSECRKIAKPSTPFVFTAYDGRRRMGRNWVSQQFTAMRDTMGLPWDAVLHSTRHTFCTRLGEAGADAFTIQRLAGHSSIVISQRYVHPTPARLEQAIGMLESSTKASTIG
jgi:integrase